MELARADRELLAISRCLRGHLDQLIGSGAFGLPPAPPDAAPLPQTGERAPTRRASAAPASPDAGAAPDASVRPGLPLLRSEVEACTACSLHSGRRQVVLARGDGSAGVMFVGEGPGEEEDRQGLPFVGPAGQLLDKMIAAMQLDRQRVYVCNIVKCRPPSNRKPAPEEMRSCLPFLTRQMELVAPKVVVALGATAVQGLLGTTGGITQLRGRWRLFQGKIPVMPTFHPAYLLRQPSAKRQVWADLQEVMRQLAG